MNRRGFLKALGLGAVGVALPLPVAAAVAADDDTYWWDNDRVKPEIILHDNAVLRNATVKGVGCRIESGTGGVHIERVQFSAVPTAAVMYGDH